MLGVRLSKELDERLSALSKATHRSKSYYVKEAIEDYLKEHEEDLKAIAQYEEQLLSGTLKTKSTDKIMKELGIERSDLEA